MRIFVYVVKFDSGFAPNPFHGWCTLACCQARDPAEGPPRRLDRWNHPARPRQLRCLCHESGRVAHLRGVLVGYQVSGQAPPLEEGGAARGQEFVLDLAPYPELTCWLAEVIAGGRA